MKSIGKKFLITYSAVLLSIIGLLLLFHATLYRPYLIHQERRDFENIREDVRQKYLSNDDHLKQTLQQAQSQKGVQIDIFDRKHSLLLYSSMYQQDTLPGRAYYLDYSNIPKGLVEINHQEQISMGDRQLLIDISSLDADRVLILYKPLSMINDRAFDSMMFVLYVSVPLFILGALIIYYLSKRHVEPILALQKQAQQMQELDFSNKTLIKDDDELAKLSRSMNAISDKFSQTLEALEDDVNKLTEIDRVRKEFLASISHELKTPLGIIKGYAESLEYGLVEEEEKQEYLQVIIDETDRMTQMVRSIVKLMRYEITETMNFTDSSFDQLLEEVKRRHLAMEPEHPLQFEGELVGNIRMDDKKIMQVFDNFIVNAYRFANENTPIFIRWFIKDQQLVVEIENEGPKIPADQMQSVWKPFYKIDPSRKRDQSGTGLGLAINASIISSHGGRVEVQNTEKGVAFRFLLPVE